MKERGEQHKYTSETEKKMHGLFMPPTGFFPKYHFNWFSCHEHLSLQQIRKFAWEATHTSRPADIKPMTHEEMTCVD